MSKDINVNPGNYKVAGRERQGEDIVHEAEKQAYARHHSREPAAKGRQSHAPQRRTGGLPALPEKGRS